MFSENTSYEDFEDSVLSAVKKAKIAKGKFGDKNVIDGTIGSLNDDEGNLVTFDDVWNIYKNLSNVDFARYPKSFSGTSEFQLAIKKLVFLNKKYNFYSNSIATFGGTGAITIALKSYTKPGDTVLIPSIGWGPYKILADSNNLIYKHYELFTKDDKFNINDFKNECRLQAQLNKKIIVVINDPCHNPTGYSLTNNEWGEIVSFLNNFPKSVKIILLNDIAYIDYSFSGIQKSRNYFEKFEQINNNIIVLMAFSCSKSLAAYGLRIGALIGIAACENSILEFENIASYMCRSTWSCVSNSSMLLLSEITNDEKTYDSIEFERNKYVEILEKRSNEFLKNIKKFKIPIYPYKEGFFITLKIFNNNGKEEIIKKLINKNIFLVSVENGIRIAICSLKLNEITKLAIEIKEVLY